MIAARDTLNKPFFALPGTHSTGLLASCQFFAVCSLVGRWTVALFRRLFHQSVAGLLSCSLLLTASSQLKPFVFCIAVCSPVGRRTVVFLLLSLQMPGTHSTGQLLSSAPSRKFLIVVVACSQTRSSSSSVASVVPIDILLLCLLQSQRQILFVLLCRPSDTLFFFVVQMTACFTASFQSRAIFIDPIDGFFSCFVVHFFVVPATDSSRASFQAQTPSSIPSTVLRLIVTRLFVNLDSQRRSFFIRQHTSILHRLQIVSIGMQPIPSLSPSAPIRRSRFLLPRSSLQPDRSSLVLVVDPVDRPAPNEPTFTSFHRIPHRHVPSIGTKPIFLPSARSQSFMVVCHPAPCHSFDTAVDSLRHCHSGDNF